MKRRQPIELAWHVIKRDVHESLSGDGLIVASFAELDRHWTESISRNRYTSSLFPNPSYYLPMRPQASLVL